MICASFSTDTVDETIKTNDDDLTKALEYMIQQMTEEQRAWRVVLPKKTHIVRSLRFATGRVTAEKEFEENRRSKMEKLGAKWTDAKVGVGDPRY